MKVTTKIAFTNLKQNKSKSILIGITIFLTTVLLAILGLSGRGLIKYNIENASKMYGEYHASYARVNESQLKNIETHAEFKDVGKTAVFANVESANMTGGIGFIDEVATKISNLKLSEGTMPLKENQVVAQKEFFNKLGYENPKVGDRVKIGYRINGEGKVLEKEFTISGFQPSNEINNSKNMYKAYTSESFYKSSIKEDKRSLTVCFKVNDEDSLTSDEIKDKIESLAVDVGVDKKNVVLNKGYIMWATDPGTEVIMVCVGIAVLVILFSVLVIYNIFYVGIIQKVQEYGRLKAIGATKKQMKNMILKEGMILSSISIPLGLIFGYIGAEYFFSNILIKNLTFITTTELTKISLFNLPILILVAVISLITVYLSLKKPMKLIAKISSIEAMKYQEKAKENSKRKGYESMSLFKLTSSNILRNKKRTIATIVTMGLSCMMFVVVANVAGSMDPEYDARHYVEKGDFYISLNAPAFDKTYPEKNLNNVQKQNPMDDKFINSIKSIKGVKKVEPRKEIVVTMNGQGLSEEDKYSTIEVLSKEDFNSRAKYLKKGEMDYRVASERDSIFYGWDSFFEKDGYKIGKGLNLSLFDGNKEIPMDFIMKGSFSHSKGRFVITEDTFNKLNIKGNMTTDIFVTCEKGQEASVKAELEDLTSGSEYYEIESYADALKSSKFAINMTRAPMYALLSILGVIGFMNMANTLITSIVTRKRELGILQAIGLTTKQLNGMLQMEGLIFTLGTLGISLTLGNVLGYVAFIKLKEAGMLGLNEYHFPMLELGIMVIVLVLLQTVLSFYMSKSLQKDALIDRIRHQ